MSTNISLKTKVEKQVFDSSLTRNLMAMVIEVGLYNHLYKPDSIGCTKARDLISPLSDAIVKLNNNPDHYKKFNPENGWGNLQDFHNFLTSYLEKCKAYPDADVKVS